MFSSISSNVTSWLGGTAPDDGPESQTTNAQSPVSEEEKPTQTQTEQSAESEQKETPKDMPPVSKEGTEADKPAESEANLQHQLDEVGAKAVNTAKEWGSE